MNHPKLTNNFCLIILLLLSIACSKKEEKAIKKQTPVRSKIVGGKVSKTGSWKFMAALYDEDDDSSSCGGALIHPQWILTAAHCGHPDYAIINRNHLDDWGRGEAIYIDKVVHHPDYNPKTEENDIALLRLETPSNSPTIQLADWDDIVDLFPGQKLKIMGWGLTSRGAQNSVLELREGTVEYYDYYDCKDIYADYGHYLPKKVFCAGLYEGGVDTCQGDSGGPILIKKGSEYVVAGVVSFGIGCAYKNTPGAYTDVTEFEDWLYMVQELYSSDE